MVDTTARPRCRDFRGVCWHSGAASTRPASLRKSVKSRRLIARTQKVNENPSDEKSARLPRGWIGGGWTRSRASDVGRSGNVFCDINYKASVAGGALGAASARRRPCALAAVFPSAPANWRRFVHPSRNVSPFPLFFSSQIPSRSSFLFSSQRRSASGARVVAPPDLRPPRCLGVPAVQSFSSSAVSSRIPS